jgi:hypothetical protein
MVKRKMTYPAFIKIEPPRPKRLSNRMRVRPPPILIPNPSIGTHHTMILVEAWQWLRTIKPTRPVLFVRLLPDPMPDPQLAPSQDLLSLCFLENPEGLLLYSLIDYCYYYDKLTTHMRRPEPHEYISAFLFFKQKKRIEYIPIDVDVLFEKMKAKLSSHHK